MASFFSVKYIFFLKLYLYTNYSILNQKKKKKKIQKYYCQVQVPI